MAMFCTIDAAGIRAPDYATILAELQTEYRAIYGVDVYLDADSQDGQLLALFALAISDSNAQAIAIYNAFSPATAIGQGLSRVVKINGIARNVPTNSTVDLAIGGTVGTIILNGIAKDAYDQRWLLPASVTIPGSGTITVTATAEEVGALEAPANTVTHIATPTLGWQTVNNAAMAVAGEAVESDADLRRRQDISVALPSRTVLEGLVGALLSLDGVTRLMAYENDTSTTDANGVPSHSLAIVIEGGNVVDIAETIANKKTPGAGTYGTTTEVVTDIYGVPRDIKFSRPIDVPIEVELTIEALSGYTSLVGDAIKEAIAAYITALNIGQDVYITKLYLPANLTGAADSATYDLTILEISRDGDPVAPTNVVIDWNEEASCVVANITLTVV